MWERLLHFYCSLQFRQTRSTRFGVGFSVDCWVVGRIRFGIGIRVGLPANVELERRLSSCINSRMLFQSPVESTPMSHCFHQCIDKFCPELFWLCLHASKFVEVGDALLAGKFGQIFGDGQSQMMLSLRPTTVNSAFVFFFCFALRSCHTHDSNVSWWSELIPCWIEFHRLFHTITSKGRGNVTCSLVVANLSRESFCNLIGTARTQPPEVHGLTPQCYQALFPVRGWEPGNEAT